MDVNLSALDPPVRRHPAGSGGHPRGPAITSRPRSSASRCSKRASACRRDLGRQLARDRVQRSTRCRSAPSCGCWARRIRRDPESLAAQPKWKRTVIIGAGAFDEPRPRGDPVFSAGADGAAPACPQGGAKIAQRRRRKARLRTRGLQAGDQIVKVNGRDVRTARGRLLPRSAWTRGRTSTSPSSALDPRAGVAQTIGSTTCMRAGTRSRTRTNAASSNPSPTGHPRLPPFSSPRCQPTPAERAEPVVQQTRTDFADVQRQNIAPRSPGVVLRRQRIRLSGPYRGAVREPGRDRRGADARR